MAEDRRANWPRHEADRVHAESFECADKRVRAREEQLREDQAGDDAVEKEVVPLDRGANRARDDRAEQLLTMLRFGDTGAGERTGAHEQTTSIRRRRRPAAMDGITIDLPLRN